MGWLDSIVFIAFVALVLAVGLTKSRNEKSSEDYFLAGRSLKWWLIGFSLIAANISSEQFVGMSGNAASHVGMAIASYEWMAAITLVVVAFCFLPYFLRAGIYTMPEFLEYRYNSWARLIMAVCILLIYMLLLGAITYSGALTVNTMASQMQLPVVPTVAAASLVIGLIAMIYVAAGGLKACAWADLIQGSALIIGGGVIMVFAFQSLGAANEASYIADIRTGAVAVKTLSSETGAFQRFVNLNRQRLTMFLPADDPVLPWTALLLGLWIPNFYYWGLNQYITQRTLGSASLAEGQKGIVFAAFMKLLIPLVIVIPGLIAFNLFSEPMKRKTATDNASVIARYAKANPSTQAVAVLQDPAVEQIHQAVASGRIVLGVISEKSAPTGTVGAPQVLTISRADWQKIAPIPYSVFMSDDKSFASVFPALAEEMNAFNQTVQHAAKAAGAPTHTEKLIGYKYDSALGLLLSNVLPKKSGLIGFVLAALLGAIVSSLAALLNAASTIFTMDIFKKYVAPQAGQKTIVLLGRICVVVFTAVAVFLAPALGNPKFSHSIFTIIQESQGFISPGVLCVFLVGLTVRRAPRFSGVAGLLTSIIVYGALKYISTVHQWMSEPIMNLLVGNFLNRMGLTLLVCLTVMGLARVWRPLPAPVEFKINNAIELSSSSGAKLAGSVAIVATLVLYVIFSPLILAK